jgi:hypothetical protein
MKRTATLLLMLTVSLLLLPGMASAACTVGTCSGADHIMDVSGTSNAHGALAGQGSGYSSLCCADLANTGSNEQTILRLSGTSNAHACTPLDGSCSTPYTNDVKVYTRYQYQTGLSCYYSDSCDQGDVCVVALSGQGNAHLADCDSKPSSYGVICCHVTTDSQKPTASHSYANEDTWASGEQTITITAYDGESGVKEIGYCWGSSCDPGSGTKVSGASTAVTVSDTETRNGALRYRAWDNANNPSDIGSVSVKVDNSAPSTTCSSHADGAVVGPPPITLSLAATDEGAGVGQESGVDKIFYCYYITGAGTDCTEIEYIQAPGIGTDCYEPATVCEYNIKFHSEDNQGNVEATDTITVTYDKSMPSCNFNTTTLPGNINNNDVQLEWDSSDPLGGTFVRYNITAMKKDNNGYFTIPEGPSLIIDSAGHTSDTFTVSGGDSDYRFQCIATYDRAGTEASSSADSGFYEVTVDTQKPAVNLTTPAYVNSEGFDITWTGDDGIGSGIDYYVLNVDGSPEYQGSQTSYPYTGQHGQGYAMELVAYDMVGWESDPATGTVTVDAAPPTCMMTDFPAPFQGGTSIDLSWSGQDDGSGVESYDLCINTDGSECTEPTPGWEDLILPSGTYTQASHNHTYHFRCRARDIAGNTGAWSGPVSVTMDTRAPEFSRAEYESDPVAGDDILVNTTITDDTGIEGVVLSIGDDVILPQHSSPGATEWSMSWSIPYITYGGRRGFSITVTDTAGNVDTRVFNYSILECTPGMPPKPCHPRDKAKDELYDKGVCAYTGHKECINGMWSETCTGGVMPSDETCDGIDNDCDGETDDGLQNAPCGPTGSVTGGKSICRLGTRSCSNGIWTSCEGAKEPESQEICGNGWDDDCDGTVDNGCVCSPEGERQSCGISNIPPCQLGYQLCEGGRWSSCRDAVLPEDETCDGIDNDCDGETDEGVCGEPVDMEQFPWWILIAIGVAMLAVLAILWLYFRKHGEELTWETLSKKWTPA